MADIKMSEFQQVADVNYVYVEDVNGGQAKMTLKDFNSNLPRNLCWSGILNKGETVELKAEYKLIYVCETSKTWSTSNVLDRIWNYYEIFRI